MPITKSPLRYPGGKSQLTRFVQNLIEINKIKNAIYCEPFAGGFGAGLNLLFSGTVESVILNDLDTAIYSIWYAILNDTIEFSNKILNAQVNLDEWKNQREIYNRLITSNEYTLELAYSAFFLNRTNISGIITGGPIGGISQEAKDKLDCRFNKQTLITKIQQISSKKDQIVLYNKDATLLIKEVLLKIDPKRLFVFFDPPYYHQGKNLYTNYYTHADHLELKNSIDLLEDYNWIVTYDDEYKIDQIYKEYTGKKYKINYSANTRIKATESIYFSDGLLVQPHGKLQFI